jgi:MFS superfamily sulfate permease-like transporter
MSDAAGGRTQLAALVAAAAIACVLIFLTGPLQYVPIPALGAVLVMTALSLVATLGVVLLGSLRGILLAVVLALVRFIRLVARPSWEILGIVPGVAGLHSTESHPAAQSPPACASSGSMGRSCSSTRAISRSRRSRPSRRSSARRAGSCSTRWPSPASMRRAAIR